MKSSRSTSNNSVDTLLNPHPPNDPFHSKSESSSKLRQRRYTHQISDQKNDAINFDNREIKSAGSNTDALYSNQKPDRLNYKSKVSSAPSPRSRICSDYRSNTIHREESSGLYTFNSIPSLIPDTNDSSSMPRTKRKENVVHLKTSISNSKEVPIEPNLPSLVISKSMNPCKSEASPVTSIPFTLRVSRRSLQQLSKEKLMQRSRKSMQSSLGHSKWLENLADLATKSSLEVQNNEPINLSQYRLANDLSESFENRVLASLVAQNAHEVNIDNVPKILPRILNSQDFSKFTPRTEAALMCGSYSDEESSATTTAPFTNNKESGLNLCSERYEMHNEWKSHINCSQDTSRSTDFINSVTDSYCNSTICDETNTNTTQKNSRYQDYLLVRYIPEFGCFYDPETGTFYELTF